MILQSIISQSTFSSTAGLFCALIPQVSGRWQVVHHKKIQLDDKQNSILDEHYSTYSQANKHRCGHFDGWDKYTHQPVFKLPKLGNAYIWIPLDGYWSFDPQKMKTLHFKCDDGYSHCFAWEPDSSVQWQINIGQKWVPHDDNKRLEEFYQKCRQDGRPQDKHSWDCHRIGKRVNFKFDFQTMKRHGKDYTRRIRRCVNGKVDPNAIINPVQKQRRRYRDTSRSPSPRRGSSRRSSPRRSSPPRSSPRDPSSPRSARGHANVVWLIDFGTGPKGGWKPMPGGEKVEKAYKQFRDERGDQSPRIWFGNENYTFKFSHGGPMYRQGAGKPREIRRVAGTDL